MPPTSMTCWRHVSNFCSGKMKKIIDKAIEKLKSMGIFSPCDEVKAEPFYAKEDGAAYNVWKMQGGGKRYVLKEGKNCEVEVYTAFLSKQLGCAPTLIACFEDDGKEYLVIEYVDGEDLCECDRERLQAALDVLIALQNAFWGAEEYASVGYTYEKDLASCMDRAKYLGDSQLESAYAEFLELYKSLPRTLCHDDLLPFNVLVNGARAVIIDWEYAGILPYPLSLARLLAHAGEENCFFKMREKDKMFALEYYYENLVKAHGISKKEYEHTMQAFLFYEYTEWIMLANKYENADKKRGEEYLQKAKSLLQDRK